MVTDQSSEGDSEEDQLVVAETVGEASESVVPTLWRSTRHKRNYTHPDNCYLCDHEIEGGGQSLM